MPPEKFEPAIIIIMEIIITTDSHLPLFVEILVSEKSGFEEELNESDEVAI